MDRGPAPDTLNKLVPFQRYDEATDNLMRSMRTLFWLDTALFRVATNYVTREIYPGA